MATSSAALPGPLLRRAFLRHLLHHPWQSGLTLLGVALAVAVVVGIDLANASAERAFTLGVEAVAGRTTHEIVGGPAGLDEALYAELRTLGEPWSRRMAPVVEGRLVADGDTPIAAEPRAGAESAPPPRRLRLLGIDPFAEGPLRGLGADVGSVPRGALEALLTSFGAVALPHSLAAELGLEVGESFAVRTEDGLVELTMVARLQPSDALAERAARDLVVADLSTAQELLGRVGRLDRIDLVLEGAREAERVGEGESERVGHGSEAEAVAAHLPSAASLQAREARTGALAQMTRAFRLNLTALSLLALLVGVFLIHSTLTFSVVQRRPLLGRLRAMGVRRREILALVLLEGAVLGAVATLLGLALGVGLAHGLLHLVVRTINDLYFSLSVTGVHADPVSLAKGAALGLGGAVVASLLPARDATTAPPRLVLQRSHLERRARRSLPRLAVAGVVLLALAWVGVAWPSRSLLLAFLCVLLVVVGFSLLVPAATLLLSRASAPLFAALFGVLGKMAARGVATTLSRTGVALAALTLAIAATLGVEVMILSFRATLVDWLDTTLQADVYVAADLGERGPSRTLEPRWIETARSMDGVATAITQLRRQVSTTEGPTRLFATGVERQGFGVYDLLRSGGLDRETVFERFAGGEGVLVSEPFAYHRRVEPGDGVRILTDRGPRDLEVLAVYTDYASDRGLVNLHRALYDRLFEDDGVHSVGLFLEDGVDPERFASMLTARLDALSSSGSPPMAVPRVVPNAEIKALSLQIFDRTFAITHVLRLLAVGVAFFGILSSLMALQLERRREFGVLRANGLTPAQVWGLVTAQTGAMGWIAGLLALPLGTVLAAMLVHVINRRSFGWTLHLQVPPSALANALILAIVAALLAGLYPAWKMSRSSPALALREE